jgi:phosphatidylinositol alpha-1,6-mannosyltransferase
LALAIGVDRNISFLGEVSDEDLVTLYRQCDVFVLPSRGQENRGSIGGEGFGRVYAEAALAGKPVVGSQVGGSAEAVLHGRTGLLVDPESCRDVSEALLTLLRQPQAAARMGEAGRKWANERFSEEALRLNLVEMLCMYGVVQQNKIRESDVIFAAD